MGDNEEEAYEEEEEDEAKLTGWDAMEREARFT